MFKKIAKDRFVENIDVVEGKDLEGITFRETDDWLEYKISFYAGNLFFKLSAGRVCCEDIGTTVHDCTTKEMIQDGDFDFDEFIGLTIKEIRLLENRDMSLKIVFENNQVIRFGFYSYHNGYYPHEILITYHDFDNYDAGETTVFKSFL